MKVHTVRVDGQLFVLRPSQDVNVLQQDILHAAAKGAGFVKFKTVGRSVIRVLITPQVAIRFETFHRDKAQFDEWEKNPPSIDVGNIADYEDVL